MVTKVGTEVRAMVLEPDRVLDVKGLKCPMPVVRTRKVIDEMAPGQVLKVEATDPGSMADFRAWTRSMGHELLAAEQSGEVYTYLIRKKGGG